MGWATRFEAIPSEASGRVRDLHAIVEDEFTTLLEESEPQQRQTEPEPQSGLHTTAHFDGSPPLLPPLHDLRRTVATAGESHSTSLARPASNPFLY